MKKRVENKKNYKKKYEDKIERKRQKDEKKCVARVMAVLGGTIVQQPT